MSDAERDALLDSLQHFPQQVAALVGVVPTERWRERAPGGGFAVVEHLCHLRDLEREGFIERIGRILAEDMPELHEIDGSALADERHYLAQDAVQALGDWQAARARTVAMLREALPRHALRKGVYGGFGVVTLAALAEGINAHDQTHGREMEELVALLREGA